MDFLLNPNFAYILLVLGAVFTLLAIITPGTGFVEVIALFSLSFSGYIAYKLGFNLWALFLLILMLIPFIYSIRKPHRKPFLFLSILMLIIGSMYLYPSQGWKPAINPWLVAVVSILVGLFSWFVVQKTITALISRPSHDLDSLVGQIGEAKTDILAEGSVQVDGELWTARSEKFITQGKFVRVISREGFTLVVDEDDQEKK